MCSDAVRPPPRLRAPAFAIAMLALSMSGCAGHFVARGSDLYEDGHYVEAAEVFERTEARLATCSNRDRARFGLYRGATFLKLGDVQHAARWLGYARGIKNSDPEALGSDDSELLDASLKALGSVSPSVPNRKDGSELATAPAEIAAPPTQSSFTRAR
jgi:hypothetical protein